MTSSITARQSAPLLTLIMSALAVMVVGCGGSAKSGTTKSASTTSAASTSAATTPPPGQDNLTGTYSGHQSGAYNGTLTIIWQESGWKHIGAGAYHANLNGTIKLSNPPGTESVHGTWHASCPTGSCSNGGAIQFRTVSGAPILYSGTWNSGNMSGSYRAAKGGGSWSANGGP